MTLAVQIILVMFIVGIALGFVGAGGSGFIISILTVIFGFTIHVSLGTALAAMIFSSISGAFSHYREGDAVLKVGLAVGIFGAIGSWTSSNFSAIIPASELKWMTSGMLYLSALILWIRMFIIEKRYSSEDKNSLPTGANFWIRACGIGLVTGAISGLFGIGSACFIQIGLMFILGMSVRQSVGTTMIVIIPIALAGGAGYYHLGYLDIHLLIEVVVGTITGSYIGAKFTKRVPIPILKVAMLLVPITAATLLII